MNTPLDLNLVLKAINDSISNQFSQLAIKLELMESQQRTLEAELKKMLEQKFLLMESRLDGIDQHNSQRDADQRHLSSRFADEIERQRSRNRMDESRRGVGMNLNGVLEPSGARFQTDRWSTRSVYSE
jgi:hypothetical protein